MQFQLENTPNKIGKTNTKDMYIYREKIQISTNIQPNGSSLYKDVLYNMPIQRSLIYNMFQKKRYKPKILNHISSCPAQGNATRTTQPEEGKGRMMSNAITQ